MNRLARKVSLVLSALLVVAGAVALAPAVAALDGDDRGDGAQHGRSHSPLVHPYTFRAENGSLPSEFKVGTERSGYGRILDEITAYLESGIDGFFTDQADIGVLARDQFDAAH